MSKLWILLLLTLCIAENRCSNKHTCGESESCCKDSKGDWSCCPFPAGVCCVGTDYCCPSQNLCQPSTSSCIQDPFGFLSTINNTSTSYPSLVSEENP